MSIFTTIAGQSISQLSAQHILSHVAPEALAQSIVLVPTRRAIVSMREAFLVARAHQAVLLPRIVALADIADGLLPTLGEEALKRWLTLPAAMTRWQHRYYLAVQVQRYLAAQGSAVALEEALALATDLATLQEECIRFDAALTPEGLRSVARGGMAEHWERSLRFLTILTEHWPALEKELGCVTPARRETMALRMLADYWYTQAADIPIYAVGSTASQPATSELLRVIASLPQGAVILPGLDPGFPAQRWARIAAGHPLYHLKQLLDAMALSPADVLPLGPVKLSLWYSVLDHVGDFSQWQVEEKMPHDAIRLVPCPHPESEARTIALILREALESPGKKAALITPDEDLIARVAMHLQRYGVKVDRLGQGTLAETTHGSLWSLLLAALESPERLMPIRALLHHETLHVAPALLLALEPYWYGAQLRRPGQMPRLPEEIRAMEAYSTIERFICDLAMLARQEHLASGWISALQQVLMPLAYKPLAEEALARIFESLMQADILGPIDAIEWCALLRERLEEPQRGPGIGTHPDLSLLTPVEARLESFDRVVLGAMTDARWPGASVSNAWLNLAAQQAIGLPNPAHAMSLAAHDVLMHASAQEVFLSWSAREQGGPVTRSRYLERLLAYLEMHGVLEVSVMARHYVSWADMQHEAASFTPEPPPLALPSHDRRPRQLPVSALDTLRDNPFAFYARYVLRLTSLDPLDAEWAASDFGTLAHRSIPALTAHWNGLNRLASEGEIAHIVEQALSAFANQPMVGMFWRMRLTRALQFINQAEQERRAARGFTVSPEEPVEGTIALGEVTAVSLKGRIDRLQSDGVIGDYKTGKIPTKKEVMQAEHLQLLAYALLLDTAHAIEYWQLPHARQPGEILTFLRQELEDAGLKEALRGLLSHMLDAHTPFIATGKGYGEFEGISRDDEWAS